MEKAGNSLRKGTKDDAESAFPVQDDDTALRYERSIWAPISFISSMLGLICIIVLPLLCQHEIEKEEVVIIGILAIQLGTAVYCLTVTLCNTYGHACCFRSIYIAAFGAILLSIAGIIGFVLLTVMKTVEPQSCQFFPRILMLIQSALNIALYTLGFSLICLCKRNGPADATP